MTKTITIKNWLRTFGKNTCADARIWLSNFPNGATMLDAWSQCERADWMIWAASGERSNVKSDDQRFRLAACAIVRRTGMANGTTWDFLTDARSRNAVEVTERYARGEATEAEMSAARAAAWAAAWEAVSAAEWAAERAAGWAAVSTEVSAAGWAAVSTAARYQAAAILREYIANPWE